MKKPGTRKKTTSTVKAAAAAAPAAADIVPAPGAPSSTEGVATKVTTARPIRLPDAKPAQPPAKKPYSLPDEAYPEGTTVIQDDFNDGNPFNERDRRVVFNAWAGFTLRLVLIVAAFFSVFQYLAAREEARVGRTLDLVELWEKSEYQQAQGALKRRIAALNEEHQEELGTNPTPEEIAFYRERLGLQALTRDDGDMPLAEFQEHFDRIVYFLNRLSSCVEESLCSRKVADTFFRDYALSFWSYFAGYVDQRRKAETSFAKPIETYVGPDQASATR